MKIAISYDNDFSSFMGAPLVALHETVNGGELPKESVREFIQTVLEASIKLRELLDGRQYDISLFEFDLFINEEIDEEFPDVEPGDWDGGLMIVDCSVQLRIDLY